jgi:transcriptional regulator with XRE-family HTH domain
VVCSGTGAAANITDRREKMGLSRQQLAAKAGIDRAFLHRVEAGQRTPTVITLARLAAALDTTTATLVRGV